MAICTGCGVVVPVFGGYVAYAPAGVVRYGDCIDEETAYWGHGPGIVH